MLIALKRLNFFMVVFYALTVDNTFITKIISIKFAQLQIPYIITLEVGPEQRR
jgi:hypothetical protein